jgi:uncharacterized protein YeaO (DUF488 family)
VWDWSHVDDRLFHAVEQMTHQAVNSLADLSHAVDAHDWAMSSIPGPSAALIQNVKGHLAEWLVKDHLVQAGHHVDMAVLSNQEGWDLHVDGFPVNVKDWGDAREAIHASLSAHPAVSVMVPGDAAHIPPDALHFDPAHALDLAQLHTDAGSVIADDALTNAYAQHATETGLDVASGHPHVHFPWVTAAVSGFKEIRLLCRGHTNLVRAAKNVAVDTVSVGAGMAVGAKAGAAIGTAVAPGLGTAIGTAIGGVFGALFGRLFAKGVKHAPLEAAKRAWESAITGYTEVESASQAKAEKEWADCASKQQEWLSLENEKAKEKTRQAIAREAAALAAARKSTPRQAAAILQEANDDLRRRVRQAREEYRRFPLWRRWVWPSAQIVAARRQWRFLEQDLLLWEAKRVEVEGVMAVWGENLTDEVFDLALATRGAEKHARGFLASLGLRRAKAVMAVERAMHTAVARVAQARAQANERLRAKQKEIIESTKSHLAPHIGCLHQAHEDLIAELRKAGVAVPT